MAEDRINETEDPVARLLDRFQALQDQHPTLGITLPTIRGGLARLTLQEADAIADDLERRIRRGEFTPLFRRGLKPPDPELSDQLEAVRHLRGKEREATPGEELTYEPILDDLETAGRAPICAADAEIIRSIQRDLHHESLRRRAAA